MKVAFSFSAFAIFGLFLLGAHSALGWDNPGHMAVAGLAFDELTAPQQQRLAEALKHHPDLIPIQDGFPSGTFTDRELVMAAATWPDLIRSKLKKANGDQSDDHIYDDSEQYEESKPAVTQVSYDKHLHRGWHFIDLAYKIDNGPEGLPSTPAVNAVGVVGVLVGQLKGNEDLAAKAYDFGWLLHLVGDLHQPLHAVMGVSTTLPNGDRGGNLVEIDGDAKGSSELHGYWDNILGKTARPDHATGHPRLDRDIATATRIIESVKSLPLGDAADSEDPMTWAKESFELAKKDAYDISMTPALFERKQELKATLDENYTRTATTDAQIRIRLAGHRLAKVLASVLQ